MEVSLKEILEFAKKIDSLIEERVEVIHKMKSTDEYQSEKIDLLSLSLSKAQGQFKTIIFNKENPYLGLGYSDLTQILDMLRAPLSENELSLSQELKIDDDAMVTLHTVLRHSSGQWISSRARIVPKKDDVKAFESAVNIHKKILILGLLGVAVSGDPMDDDGEIAMADARGIIAKGPSTKYNPKEQSFERINKTQLEELEYELAQYPDIAENLLDQMRIQSLADLPKSQFRVVLTRAREITKFRNNGRKIETP